MACPLLLLLLHPEFVTETQTPRFRRQRRIPYLQMEMDGDDDFGGAMMEMEMGLSNHELPGCYWTEGFPPVKISDSGPGTTKAAAASAACRR